MANSMHVKFWGVRGSYPVPGTETLIYGGNTACVEVKIGNQEIIFDAGSGIIPLGKHLLRNSFASHSAVTASIFFSHFHHDHTQGFPFFSPAYLPSSRLSLISPDFFGNNIQGTLKNLIESPVFPISLKDLKANITFNNLSDGESFYVLPDATLENTNNGLSQLDINLVRVSCLRSYAHPGNVMLYRLDWNNQSVVYASDTECFLGMDQRLIAFAKNASLLIHDAQYTTEHYLGQRPGYPCTQGFGHSTVEAACQLAAAANVEQLALFHYDPSYDDQTMDQIFQQAQTLFPRVIVPAEGFDIDLDGNLAASLFNISPLKQTIQVG
jgi:phosphoribosyl 1,2-cyclic phosphodiesterase